MKLNKASLWLALAALLFGCAVSAGAQVTTATLQGHVTDATGGAIPAAKVTATNKDTGLTRGAAASPNGDYVLPELPVGSYTVSAEHTGFQRQVKTVVLLVGQIATLDFTLPVGEVSQKVVVEGTSPVLETTKTQVSTVITQHQIQNLPVNGRDFISFTLLSPAVQIGDTTSGSTDVIVEPVLKISFAGQNIHDNFIAVDGADDISTVSGWQRGTPPQESVREFRVINSDYTTDFGRAVGGIVNIITKSGTNDWHGSLYEYFRNGKLDAVGLLQAPGLNILRQNQFGASIGGPLQKNKTFIFANYEGQRRAESPFYNKVVLTNIDAINTVKTQVFGIPAEPAGLNVLRVNDTDNGFVRIDHSFSEKEYFFARYFVSDDRLTNQSALNDGFDLPSSFRNNFIRDQSLMTNLTSNLTPNLVNVFIAQFARRSFDFPTVGAQPHLEVLNTFTLGVNRGNPDFYRETRFEGADNFSWIHAKHTIEFGGDFNWVRSRESFPLFYPFEAHFAGLESFLGTDGLVSFLGGTCPTAPTCPHPSVIFFERFQAPSFDEKTFDPSVFQAGAIPQNIRNQAEGLLDHTYNDFFIQDKWRATSRLTMNFGLRYGFETWPSEAVEANKDNFDPRIGLAYNVGTSRHFVVRAGFGLFHGILPSPLLGCQIPSCGGVHGPFPGRTNEDALNANTELFAFAAAPDVMNQALTNLLNGHYPDDPSAPNNAATCTAVPLSNCGFFGQSVIVRFAKKHQNPYGVQASLSLEFEPFRDTVLNVTYLHVKGVHLGSFFNINQPPPSSQVLVHTSGGASGCKNVYFANASALPPDPSGQCPSIYPPPPSAGGPVLFPGISPLNFTIPVLPIPYAIYLEADSRWNSVFDGLLINMQKRFTHHFSYGISYTWSKTIDDGPNPSFVIIPQDSRNIRAERTISADDLRHRFVFNGTLAGPTRTNVLLRNYQWSTIVTLQSPMHFTKFAGFDANGDVFDVNDRVGLEPRNTFRGDALETVDLRMSRSFAIREHTQLEFIAEAFNLLNKVNIRFFNTVYGAADFCPQGGPAVCGSGPFFQEGSPNPQYGTPRAVLNPRQIQFALRLTF